jgi:DNA-binding MarR family transcriptional regulator
MIEMCEVMTQLSQKKSDSDAKESKIRAADTSTDRQINSATSTHPSTHNSSFKPLNAQNMPISIGNQGVQTDRQTDTSTDRQTENAPKIQNNSIDNALEMLDSLDNIKKEIRLKFKRLTEQEILVFTSIYQLDEELGHSDYKMLSKRLNLTESSIRDYVGRLIKKGIPVEKNKINNKNIQLNVSSNLKKIATLPTILQLRDL